MKTRFLSSLFFSLALAGQSFAADTGLILVSADGTAIKAKLSEINRVDVVRTDNSTTMEASLNDGTKKGNLNKLIIGGNTGLMQVFCENLEVYPNPVSEKIFISGAGDAPKVEVLNMNGAIVLRSIGNEVVVSSLGSGVYILSVNGKFVRFVKK